LSQGSYYYYKGERIAQGREKAQQHLKDNPEMAKEMEAEVSAAMVNPGASCRCPMCFPFAGSV
jgi:recombination protein RecA